MERSKDKPCHPTLFEVSGFDGGLRDRGKIRKGAWIID
jgi:hypothetical protein